jgi:hypothetical protein
VGRGPPAAAVAPAPRVAIVGRGAVAAPVAAPVGLVVAVLGQSSGSAPMASPCRRAAPGRPGRPASPGSALTAPQA